MWRQEMVEQLKGTKNGERQAVMERYMKMTGLSMNTLYKVAKKMGYESGRKQRADKGKCELTEQQLTFVSGLIYTSSREKKGAIMQVETALQIAEDNGVIDAGSISVSRLSAVLREKEMSGKALMTPDPKIKMRSTHPNHVHVLDASVCIQYYLKGTKRQRTHIMDKRDFYKNKPHNFDGIRDKLIRYVLTDHFSHTIFLKYYSIKGENQDALYDFILSAWSGNKHEKFPFRGVPDIVLMDKGSANTSEAILTFMERLGITIPNGAPYNPSRQGSAEVAHNIIEPKFESKLRFQPAYSVDQLNAWALDWCVRFNATKTHTRHGMKRMECWLLIKEKQLRELPEADMRNYLFARQGETRKVRSDYTISFTYKKRDTQEYLLKHIEGIIPGRSEVIVIVRPYSWPEIGIQFNGKEYLASPVGKVEGGFSANAAIIGQEYRSLPESSVQKTRKAIEEMAYNVDRKKDDIPFDGLTVFGRDAEKVTLDYIPKQGTPVVLKREKQGQQEISIMSFINTLRLECGPISTAVNQAIREKYGSSITLSESDRIRQEVRMGAGILEAMKNGGDYACLDAMHI